MKRYPTRGYKTGNSHKSSDSRVNRPKDSRATIIANLATVFEDVNLSRFPNISPNAPPDVLANYVIENMSIFPKKEKVVAFEPDNMEHTFVDLVESAPSSVNGKVLYEFMESFRNFFDREINLRDGNVFNKNVTFQLLRQEFPLCRTLLIEQLVEEFCGRFSAAAAICFFVESGFSNLVKKYFLHISDSAWDMMTSPMPIPWKRRKTWIEMEEIGNIFDSYKVFRDFIEHSKKEFPDIFEENHLSKIAAEIEVKSKIFECGVCRDEFPQSSAILCSFLEVIDLLGEEKAGPSNVNNARGDEDKGPHSFCLECVRGQALAATTEMPLADGGVGLRCMMPDCKNPILFSKCRSLIPKHIRRLLDERIWEETLGAAKLQNLERCKRCNFAVQIEAPKEDVKVFDCLKCGLKFCRICDRNWDEKHFGKPCIELDEEENVDIQARKIINQMTETVMRKCHKCSLPFVKWDGCNRVYCRCGATQCYVCRAPNINYNHFCSHIRHLNQKGCTKCKKKCLLWEDIDKRTDAEVERIRVEALKNGINIEAGQLKKKK